VPEIYALHGRGAAFRVVVGREHARQHQDMSAPADGYTLLVANSGHQILGAMNKNLPFDPVEDFAGIAMAGESSAVLAVPPAVAALAKASLKASLTIPWLMASGSGR